MESQPLAQVQVSPTNREATYVVIALLGVSVVIGTCLLTYSLNDYSKLKWNAEIPQIHISSRGENAPTDLQRIGDRGTAANTVDAVSAAVKNWSMPEALQNETGVNTEAQRDAARWTDAASVVQDASNSTLTVTARQEVYGDNVAEAQLVSVFQVNGGYVSVAAVPATEPEAAMETAYSAPVENATESNTTVNGFEKGV